MKKLLLLALIFCATGAAANEVTDSLKANVNPICYNRLFLGAGVVAEKRHAPVALEVGYTRGFRMAAETRHYLEAGIDIEYISGNGGGSLLAASVPFNYTYRIPVGTKGLTLSPYGGMALRVIMAGDTNSRLNFGLQTGLNVDYGRFAGGLVTHFNVASFFAVGVLLRVGVRF